MIAETPMLAARYHGESTVRVEEVDLPALGKSEVLVKVAYAATLRANAPRPPSVGGTGICGSDLHEVYHGPFTCCPMGSPHPLTGATLPATLGHEFSGTIEEVGEGVSKSLKVGMKVCIEPVISCLNCSSCKSGDRPLCDTRIGFFGYNRPGGLAPYVNVTEGNVHVVPEGVPLDVAALAEPLSVAWHAVACSGFKAGESALVIGLGPIGALVTRVLKSLGASAVYVSEPTSVRGKIASQCGADAVFNPLEVDVVAEVRKLTPDGQGVNVAIDCAGTQRTLDAAIDATRAKGRIVMVALWMPDAPRPTVDMSALLFKERILTGSCCFNASDMQNVLAALSSGQIRVDDLITSRILLQDIVESGLETLRKEPAQVKILVDLEASVKKQQEGK
ncbi:hypothetical protein JCM10213_009324 [Rhodosporidiobolus nylandii]